LALRVSAVVLGPAYRCIFSNCRGQSPIANPNAKGKPAPAPSNWPVTSQIDNESTVNDLYGDRQHAIDVGGISFSQYFDGKSRTDGTVKSILADNGEWVLDLSSATSKRLIGLRVDGLFNGQPISDNAYLSSRCTELGSRADNLRLLTNDGDNVDCGTYLQGDQFADQLRVPTRWTRLNTDSGYAVIEGVSTGQGCAVTYWDRDTQRCIAPAGALYDIDLRIRFLAPEEAF